MKNMLMLIAMVFCVFSEKVDAGFGVKDMVNPSILSGNNLAILAEVCNLEKRRNNDLKEESEGAKEKKMEKQFLSDVKNVILLNQEKTLIQGEIGKTKNDLFRLYRLVCMKEEELHKLDKQLHRISKNKEKIQKRKRQHFWLLEEAKMQKNYGKD